LLPSSILGCVRSYLLARRLRSFPVRQARHRYGDVELTVELSDDLAVGWYDADSPPLPELQLLAPRLKANSLVFDLGAHQGVVALQLANAVGESGRVIALEANPHNAQAAQRNKELNGAENLQILHAAVAEVSGPVVFNSSLNGSMDDGSGKFGKITVDGWSIDDLAERFGIPDLIYLDVEGYELKALNGARKVLSHRPNCFVEVHARGQLQAFGGSVDQLLGFFPAAGYDLWVHAQEREGYEVPQKYEPKDAILSDRFFLTAIAKH